MKFRRAYQTRYQCLARISHTSSREPDTMDREGNREALTKHVS